jgi:hypothetical protein
MIRPIASSYLNLVVINNYSDTSFQKNPNENEKITIASWMQLDLKLT